MYKAAPVTLSLVATSLFAAGTAGAYQVRKTAAGTPVHWDAETITVVADASLARLGPKAIDAISRAFATWSEVQGTGAPGVVFTEGIADEVGYREGADNRCTLRYESEGYTPAGGALAITVLTFDGAGKIVDADIVINGGGSHGFAVLPDSDPSAPEPGAAGGSYDIEDVLSHEVGHLFGLAHNDGEADATMYFATARGEIKKRDLSPDDEAGFRSLYPDARGFTAACSARPGARGSEPGAAAALVLAAIVVGARRRRPQDR